MRMLRIHGNALGALLLIVSAALAVDASAQIGKREPVEKPIYGGGFSTFTVTSIPQFPDGARLGALSVGGEGDVYVWAVRRVPRETIRPEDPRRDFEPPIDRGGGFDATVVASMLYRLRGDQWTVRLDLTGETAGPLLAVGKDVYAATNLPDGTVAMHRFDGKRWRLDKIAAGVTGPAVSIVGDGQKVFFRTGNSILQRCGRNWHVIYADECMSEGGALAFVSRDEVYAPCCHGQLLWNGHAWSWTESAPLADIHAAWAGRDAAGELHLFKAGSDMAQDGPCLWQFVENRKGSLTGEYRVALDGACAATHTSGHATVMWGAGVHDVLAAGSVGYEGVLYAFDGASWTRHAPLAPMPFVTGIGGRADGEAWIALADGRLLHRPAQVMQVEPGFGVIEPGPGVRPDVGRTKVSALHAPGAVTVELTLAAAADVTVTVHDVAGRQVATLEKAWRDAGVHRLTWRTGGFAPGVYFCAVRSGGALASTRVMVIR